jgi:hypothetical protein
MEIARCTAFLFFSSVCPPFSTTLWEKKRGEKYRRDEIRMAHVVLRNACGPLAYGQHLGQRCVGLQQHGLRI